MKSLSDVNLKKIFPPNIYKRGQSYYKENKVSDLLYDRNHEVWTSTVQGSVDYFVEIDVKNIDKGRIETYCDCPAFDTFGTCKHIAATMISIANKNRDGLSSNEYQSRITEAFINKLSNSGKDINRMEFLPQKKPMYVEYHCKWTYDRKLLIELKTGEKHRYVVKDLFDLLEHVLQGNEYVFTKKFTFHPEQHYFSEKDLEIFEILYQIKENEAIYEIDRYYRYQGLGYDQRHVVVPPFAVKGLLERLVNRDFTVDSFGEVYTSLSIEKESLPFQFSLTKSNEGKLLLTMDKSEGLVYLKPYQILFQHGTFYFPTKKQIPILEDLLSFGTENLKLPITKKQADNIVSEVLPSLKKVGKVEVAENVKAEIIQYPLKAKLFLELIDDIIIGKLEYHYGMHVIDPFNGRNDGDVIIIRDVEKEQQIMQLIEHANFHYNGKELYLQTGQEEELYEFLYYIIPHLDKQVELFLTSEIRHLLIEQEVTPSTSVRLESSSNLLEVGFNMSGIDENEIQHILAAVIEKKRYYRLNSGALMPLEGEGFSSIQQFIEDMDISKKDFQQGNVVQLPVYRGAQIDEVLHTKKDYDPAFRQLMHQLKAPEEQVYELPSNLQVELRSYQVTGFQWFKSLSQYHLGGILADDMGLGKTLQSIAYIASEEPENGPHLVVAPSSVVYNWKNEFDKFAPHLQVTVMTGIPEERHEKIEALQHADVWITSYSTVRQDIELYRELRFQTLILDEAQYIKNYQTKTSRAIREITASRRFALSGTPIENSIDELWAIFQVVLPGLLPNQRQFKQLSNEKIAMITRPFILRRLKKDVLTELPDKIETVSTSELTKEQKELYLGYLKELQQETAQSIVSNDFQQNRMKILAGLTRLRQICCHPSLFIENYTGQSGKLEQLMETVKSAIENGRRMLIFSQFTSMHEIIIGRLEEEGIGYFYLNGQTPSKERVEMSHRFNQGEKEVFLISLKAGGTGLNLTGADTVILYDLWWNPAVEDQATGRAHRFGQKNVVQVIRLITEGTIEEKIYELQQKKRELIEQVVQPGETMLTSLSEDDIKEILSIS